MKNRSMYKKPRIWSQEWREWRSPEGKQSAFYFFSGHLGASWWGLRRWRVSPEPSERLVASMGATPSGCYWPPVAGQGSGGSTPEPGQVGLEPKKQDRNPRLGEMSPQPRPRSSEARTSPSDLEPSLPHLSHWGGDGGHLFWLILLLGS